MLIFFFKSKTQKMFYGREGGYNLWENSNLKVSSGHITLKSFCITVSGVVEQIEGRTKTNLHNSV